MWRVWHVNLRRCILSFDDLDGEEDVAEAATRRVVFITKWVRLAWTEDPSRACPLVVPNGHALVKTHHPRGDKEIGHVLVPGPDHLPDLPELVAICRRDGVSEGELLHNRLKPLLPHVPFKVAWAGALLLRSWHRVIVPILLHRLPLKRRHQEMHPNVSHELTEHEWRRIIPFKLRTHQHQQNSF